MKTSLFKNNSKQLLTHAVLASSLFASPYVLADVVNVLSNVPRNTTVDGDITITSSGQLNTVSTAVTVNSASATVQIDAANVNGGNAILTNQNGIDVVATGTNAQISIGANSTVNAVLTGVQVAETGATLTNAGTILGVTGVDIKTGGTGMTLNNLANGDITATGVALKINATGLDLTNDGTITGGANFNTIELNATTANFDNTVSGKILSSDDGILIGGAGPIGGDIENSGLISTTGGAGTGAITVGNTYTGVITNFATGTIEATNGGHAFLIQAPFNQIDNFGTIQSTAAGDTIAVTAASGGTINNSNIIQNTGTGNAISLGGNITQINNLASGSITAANPANAVIYVSANNITLTGGIINSGNITHQAGGTAIDLQTAGGNINAKLTQNAGTITGDVLLASAGGDVLEMNGGTIDGLVKSSTNADTLNIKGGTITKGILTQSGNDTLNIDLADIQALIDTGTGNDVVNITSSNTKGLSTGDGDDEVLIDLVSLIDGDINTGNNNDKLTIQGLSQVTGNVLIGDGADTLVVDFSIIDGNVDTGLGADNVTVSNGSIIGGNLTLGGAGDAANILNFSDSTLLGSLNLGGGGNTVTLTNGSLQAINGGAGADVINVNGVTTFTNLNGGAGADVLNLNSSFTTMGTISNMQTINVNNAGTVFTINNPISGVDTQLLVNSGTTMNVNDSIQGLGNLQNNGTLNMAVTGSIDMNSFNQSATGALNVDIQNGMFGPIIVDNGGANLAAGSTVFPNIIAGQFIPNGTTFDIITANNGGIVTDNSTLLQPPSLIYSFDKQVVGGNILQLTANRALFSSFAPAGSPCEGVAYALDVIAQQGPIDPDIIALFGQLDVLTTQQDLKNALLTLVPSTNYGMIMASRIGMDNAITTIERRIEELGQIQFGWEKTKEQGYSYGCPSTVGERGPGTTWLAVYGNVLNQRNREDFFGYKVNAVGVGAGTDYEVGCRTTLGAAFHWTSARSDSKSPGDQEQEVSSYQGTVYFKTEPTECFFVDGFLAAVSHSYDLSRTISVGTLTTGASAETRGFQWGGQLETGLAFTRDDFYFVPIARMRYTRLEIGSYTETGAGGLSLAVENDQLDEFVGAVGVRMAAKRDFAVATYVPEIQLLTQYDFIADPQSLVTSFVGQGPQFTNVGIQPSRNSYVLGLGITVHTSDNFIFKVKYEVDARDQYVGHSGYMQLWYRFRG